VKNSRLISTIVWFYVTLRAENAQTDQTIEKVGVLCDTMEPTHNASEEWDHKSTKTWVVEYTVEVDEESHRHLSLIIADKMADVHHRLLGELRKAYQARSKVDVTVHRIEPVTTNTNDLYFEGIYAP
jgi:hypothetical protein|tara:strand:- start:160 stop:540 length:381 start_codon:yes stop_codon:yes gene_type:complete